MKKLIIVLLFTVLLTSCSATELELIQEELTLREIEFTFIETLEELELTEYIYYCEDHEVTKFTKIEDDLTFNDMACAEGKAFVLYGALDLLEQNLNDQVTIDDKDYIIEAVVASFNVDKDYLLRVPTTDKFEMNQWNYSGIIHDDDNLINSDIVIRFEAVIERHRAGTTESCIVASATIRANTSYLDRELQGNALETCTDELTIGYNYHSIEYTYVLDGREIKVYFYTEPLRSNLS